MDRNFLDADDDLAATPTPVPPRRARGRRRRRKAVLGLGPRWGLLAAGAALAVMALCAIVAKIAQPYDMQRQQGAQMRSLQTQLAAVTSSDADLTRQTRALLQPEGYETAARAQGYLMPGEVSLEITAAAPAPAPVPSDAGLAGALRRAWGDLTRK